MIYTKVCKVGFRFIHTSDFNTHLIQWLHA